ncbi:uncharacterized protein LOC122651152 [Telopea speciosissima]|uniref:uncharacterized protein LOC122651152 n=1 Tax=Telopea speciosissima TaxID=54955 RepID=UPI001CC76A66|nr:uncharacterized protein LOC122651152 [Telopea speciosissima]
MGKGGCGDESLDTPFYGEPVPLIGLYIASATLVCFFSMTYDLVHGFVRKKPFIPCKLFPINSFTMTLLSVATKIPADLTTYMPRVEDQLSKLTGTALLCISLGFYMPSLGTTGPSERYGNLAALSVMVITLVVNVCIQMGTGVIYGFIIEHIIIMVCILLLLLFLWSSAIAFRSQTECRGPYLSKISEAKDNAKDVNGLRKLLVKLHVLNYTGNPQTLLCETSHHNAFGLLCTISLAVVLQAMLRSFALKNMWLHMRLHCNGGDVSDYKWSIPVVIVSQFLTILVGTVSIIYRWISFLGHTHGEDVRAHQSYYSPELELEYLKLNTLSFRFLNKNFSSVFLVAKNFVMDVLIHTQIVLYTCSSLFIGLPIYTVKKFLKYIISFDNEQSDEDIDEMYTSAMRGFVLSFVNDDIFHPWISKMAMKDMMRWRNTYKSRDCCATQLIQLISKCPLASVSKSECVIFIRKLEATGEEFLKGFVETDCLGEIFKIKYDYRVSCVSVLVLTRMLAELFPSSRAESLKHILEALNESFETIYFVDQKTTDASSMLDEARWTSAKDVWAQWENPNHWFRSKIISPAFKKCSLKKSEESELKPQHVLEFLGYASQAIEEFFRQNFEDLFFSALFGVSLTKKHVTLIAIEFSIICKFILEQNYESVEDVFDFLEMCFVKILCFNLSSLPLAILKEINGDDPFEIGERRVKKAFKFFCELELLGDTIEWSWPATFVLESQANDVRSLVQAELSSSFPLSSLAAAADGAAYATDDDDDDTIRENWV